MPEQSISVPIAGYTDIKVIKGEVGDSVTLVLDSYDVENDEATTSRYEREAPASITLWPDEGQALIEAYEAVKDWKPEPETTVEASDGLRYISFAKREAFVQSFVDAEVPMRILYRDEGGNESDRVVSPIQIDTSGYGLGQRTWLHAWDHAKESYRNFRLTRIHGIGVAGEPYVNQEARRRAILNKF